MIQSRLRVELEKVARRYRRVRLWGTLAVNWLLATAAAVALLWFSRGGTLSLQSVGALAGAFLGTGLLAGWIALRTARNEQWVARQIEARHPALQARLLTALEQQPDAQSGRLGYLQETVVREALDHGRRFPWSNTVSNGRLLAIQLGHNFSLAAFVAVLIGLLAVAATREAPLPSPAPEAGTLVAVGRYRVEVKPGDTELERGTSLVVVARFEGDLPPDADLLVEQTPSESVESKVERVPMSRSLDDPLFGGRVAAVEQDLTYRVAFDGQQTEAYRVTVFEYPALVQADARLKFPDYTSLEEKLVEDTRRVTAVEGTQLTWVCRLNKPVAEARLESDGAEPLALTAEPADPNVVTVTLTLTESRRYRLHLKDDRGRENKEPPEFVVNVQPNRPAEIEIVWPSRDTQVSPLEEFDLEATATDDFGLARYGLIYSHAGGAEQEIVLGEGSGPKEKQALDHQIDLEQLNAEPDQLFSYYFFAEDRGPDGEVRRTLSDMFFAEVRRYEEIFREGEQPAGGQQQQQQQASQNAQQAEQLAELQKQIIAGTWKLIRREKPDRLTPQFTPDARLLVESQGAAMEQLEELAGEVEDAQSQAYAEEVKQHMVAATKELMRAVDESSPEPLQAALPKEQAAYQGLLKLRAREHQVMRSSSQQPQQSSGSASSSAMQRQLDQLELKDDENRYEDQRTAQDSQQTEQQREVRQALNRLKELAQRQEDLNKQLQEMQSALEQAQTEEEKEEIERRLKRLREEEQQMLRDIDELRERMEQPQNQKEMAEAEQKLAESRENVRQASEALEQGRVSQALAEGTRAQREFEELRDEFRRKAAGQFDQQMRELRDSARQLEDQERKLAEQMQQLGQPGERRSLRDAGQKEQIAQGFEDQQQHLNDLLEQMEGVVTEAEQPEPLLADQLYDTLRSTRQANVENALDTARQLAQAGLPEQAAPAEEAARQGIEKLRAGVEKAADSVLGDETEALRRAQETLDDLTRQLEREAAERGQAGSQVPGVRGQEESFNRDPTGSAPGQLQDPNAPPQGGERPQSDEPRDQSQPGSQAGEPQEPQDQPQPGQAEGQGQAGQTPPENQAGQPKQPQQQQGGGPNPQGQPPEEQPGQSPQEQQGQPPEGQGQQGQQPQGQQQGQANQPNPASQQGEGQGGPPRQPAESQPRSPRSLRGQQGGESPQDATRGQPPQQDGAGGGRPFDHQGAPMNPLTGENFREWSDQLRDVEEMLDDPQLRAEAAEIRDRARGMRVEYKRHSEEPNWDLVRTGVIAPLAELRDRIAEELIRRQAGDSLTPIDRDPVPPQFTEPVRRYYEEIGRGK